MLATSEPDTFRPITLVIESEDEAHCLIVALRRLMANQSFTRRVTLNSMIETWEALDRGNDYA